MRASLARRKPVDQREVAALAQVTEALGLLSSPYSETADLTHITGSGIVIHDTRVLLLKHKRLGIWVQPGGHIEAGETPWEGALRECREETGLQLEAGDQPWELAHVDVHQAAKRHFHLDLRYRFMVTGDPEPRPPAGESQEIGWFGLDQAVVMTDPGLAGLLRDLSTGSSVT